MPAAPALTSAPTCRRGCRSLRLQPNARIGRDVEEIGEQTRDERGQGGRDGKSEDCWIVAGKNRLEVQPADAVPLENLFDDDASRNQVRQRDAEKRDERNERVAKAV